MPEDGGLFGKLSRPERASVGGGADALLKADEPGCAMRKLDASDGSTSAIIRDMHTDDLAKRLSARGAAGLRKSMGLSILDASTRAEDFAGSHQPGVLDLEPGTRIYNDPNSGTFGKRLAALHARGGAETVLKLLH